MGLVFLLHSAAWGIAEWLPVWAGYLIVAVVVLVIAAVLGLLGKKALDKAQPSPDRAIDQAQQTIAVLKSPLGEPSVDTAPTATAGATGTAARRREHGQRGLHERCGGVGPGRPGEPGSLSLRRTAPVDTAFDASTPRLSTGAISSRVRA